MNDGEQHKRIIHVQTVLYEDDMRRLKEKTGEGNQKDALAKAVEHYLTCEHCGKKKTAKE